MIRMNRFVFLAGAVLAGLGGSSQAGIPEPGLIVYGRVTGSNGALLTQGTLELTYSAAAATPPVSVRVEVPLALRNVNGTDYSYMVRVPVETAIAEEAVSASAIPVPGASRSYTRTARVIIGGTPYTVASVPATSSLSPNAHRSSLERLDLTAPVSSTPTPTVTPTPTAATPTATPAPGPDGDNDGRPDGCETAVDGTLAQAGTQVTNSLLPDSDGDGLKDGEESATACATQYTAPLAQTNPRNRDTDGDGFLDGLEVKVMFTDPLSNTSPDRTQPAFADADADGLPAGIDPNDANPDSDGDRYADGYERALGFDLTNASSKPSLGDSNGNGSITAADVTLLKQVLQGLPAATAIRPNLDLTRDGRITTGDVTIQKQFVAGTRLRLP